MRFEHETGNIGKALSGFRITGSHSIDPEKFEDRFQNRAFDQSHNSQAQNCNVRKIAAIQSLSESVNTVRQSQTQNDIDLNVSVNTPPSTSMLLTQYYCAYYT